VLSVATLVAYIPQYTRLFYLHSSRGVSTTAILLLALVAQHQLVTFYYLWACHPRTMYGNVIPKALQVRDWLSLAQLLVQWACSLVMWVHVERLPEAKRLPRLVAD